MLSAFFAKTIFGRSFSVICAFVMLGKYRQATAEIQKHIENLQHDLAVIGQIAGLASSLRGEHQVRGG